MVFETTPMFKENELNDANNQHNLGDGRGAVAIDDDFKDWATVKSLKNNKTQEDVVFCASLPSLKRAKYKTILPGSESSVMVCFKEGVDFMA